MISLIDLAKHWMILSEIINSSSIYICGFGNLTKHINFITLNYENENGRRVSSKYF